MSDYSYSGLYSSRRKLVGQTTSSLYTLRRIEDGQDENEVDRTTLSSVYPMSHRSSNQTALSDIMNTRHRSKAKNQKPLLDDPLVERKGPRQSPSGRALVYPDSQGRFGGAEIDLGVDITAQVAPRIATAVDGISEKLSDTEKAANRNSEVPWSYVGYTELGQVAKVQGDVLARTIQPIDKPFEGQNLEDHRIPQRDKKSINCLIGPDEDIQAGVEYIDDLQEVGCILIGYVPQHEYLSNSKKRAIERWLRILDRSGTMKLNDKF